jgi:hypothetical protein
MGDTQIGDGAVLVSLAGDASYEVFYGMFKFLADNSEWQQGTFSGYPVGEPGGWNIALNGEDVNVVAVTDEGVWCRKPLDDTWTTFGFPRFLSWEAIERIVVF